MGQKSNKQYLFKKSEFIKDIKTVLYLVNRFLRRHLKAFFVLVICNAATGFLIAMQPLTIAPAVSAVMEGTSQPAASFSEMTLDNLGPTILNIAGITSSSLGDVIGVVAISYVTLTFFIAVIGSLAFWLSAQIRGRVLYDMLVELHTHLISLSLSFFSAQREGDVISRFSSDSSATVNVLDGLFRGLLQSLVQIVIFFYLLFRTDPTLAFATIAIGGGHMLITRLLSGWVRNRTKVVYDFYGNLTATLQESIQNIRITKSLAAEEYQNLRFNFAAKIVESNLLKYRIARYTEEPVRLCADALSIIIMMLLAFSAMNSGRLTASGFGMFVFLTGRAVMPIAQFSKHFLSIFVVAGSAERVLDILGEKNPMIDGIRKVKPFQKLIQFNDVSFAYAKEAKNVLHKINLKIQQGQMTAIVGPSGSGKSTLCDLILRLQEPSNGKIFYDETDIREFSRESYLAHFGVVPQKNLLLHASVMENILYGRPKDIKQFNHAVQIANAEEFIADLPEKEGTEIGDQGVRLSGGQRQRLAIARAIYGNPSILVLDEATSSLDSESERLVQQAIDTVIKDMTAVVIAHRLSTVLHADQIVVLKDGKIEDIGKHSELLKVSPTYQRLYEFQFS